MKKIILASLIGLLLLTSTSFAATLYRIRLANHADKIRAVFDFDSSFSYHAQKGKKEIKLTFLKTVAGAEIESFKEVNDLVLKYLKAEKNGNNLVVSIPLAEPVKYKIFHLNTPPRLVIDFDREFLNTIAGGLVEDGIEFLRVKKGASQGVIWANILKLDLSKVNVEPALAHQTTTDRVDNFFSFFTNWQPSKIKKKHFYIDKVSNIVEESDAIAGINGTFFAPNGKPLGALVIHNELVSYPLYERTAFFLDEKNQPYIDNLSISSNFTLNNEVNFKITGINQQRNKNDIIMYTPIWGKKTGTKNNSLELTIVDQRVASISLGDAEIPENAYVLSIAGPELEVLSGLVKIGDRINTNISLIPYATSPQNIVQLVSGGPRLVKQGKSYVAKHQEKFRADISRGRAARTAIGITKNNQLLLVTVDGLNRKNNSKQSIGASLEELADLMISIGAQEAMNLDGGSSTTMVIDGRVVNKPTSGFQRLVSNAIVVRPKY